MSIEAPDSPPPPPTLRGPVRWLLLSLGVVFTGIAMLGAFLPVLPTTPFLLLAMAAFARSSPVLQARLLNAPIFGVYLRQWRDDRSVPRQAKWKAYGLIVVTFGFSIYWVESNGMRILLAIIAVVLLVFMRSLQTTENQAEQSDDIDESAGDRDQN